MFRSLSLKFSCIEIDRNATLMWLNKNVAKINAMFKILDIMSFRYIYICVCVCVCILIILDLELVLST